MKRTQIMAAVLVVPLFLASCASTSPSLPPVAFREEAPRNGGALIYVYRLPSFVGSAARWRVKLDSEPVAELRQKAYVAMHTSPGTHVLVVGDAPIGLAGPFIAAAARKKGTFSAEANAVYFVRCEGFKQELVSKEKAMQEITQTMYYP